MSTSMRGESNKSTRKEKVGGGGGKWERKHWFDKSMIPFAIFFVFGCFIQKDHDSK